jgi:hypothetical protein
MQLLPQATRQGLWSQMVADTVLADDWNAWQAVVIRNNGLVDPTQPTLAALLTYAVSKNYITQTLANQLLALQ